MKKSKLTLAYSTGLMLTGICGLISSICNIAGIQLPDAAARIIGAVGLVGIAVLSASIVLYLINKNKKE